MLRTPLRILRQEAVRDRVGLSRTCLYEQIKGGLFPRSVAMAGRAGGWPEHEVDAVIAARIAGKTDDDLRTLVRDMEARRAAFHAQA